MAENKKISELTTHNSGINDITDSQSDIWVPVCIGNSTNGKVNLKTLINAIKQSLIPINIATSLGGDTTAVNNLKSSLGITALELAIEDGGGGSSGGSSQPSGQSANYQLLLQLVNSLTTSVNSLQNTNNWPVNTILIVDASTGQLLPYTLYTGPGQPGGTVTIKLNNVLVPNFYVTYSMSLPLNSNGRLTTYVTINILNKNLGLNLTGGTIGIILLYGTITANVNGVSTAYTVTGTYSAWENRVISPGQDGLSTEIVTNDTNPAQVVSELESISNDVSITGATIYCRFGTTNNSPVVPGSNVYVNTGAGSTIMATSGYITLSNGS